MSSPHVPRFYHLLQRFLGFVLRVTTHLDVEGLKHLPEAGALIVASNHLHIMDAVVLFCLVPRPMTVFAADKWRGTPGGWLMTVVANAIFVARGEVDRRALAQAIGVLRGGGALGVAPEGTRSRTGGLIQGRDGTAYIASRSAAAILPVALWGQERTFREWLHGRRPTIHVRFGEPIRLPPEAEAARLNELHGYTDRLMMTLARMLPPAYRGIYAERLAAEHVDREG